MNIEKKYLKWLNHPFMDEDLKQELENMDETQKKDAFYKDAEFGTAGMRNILGAGTNRLNVYTVRKATVGFGNFLNRKEGEVSIAIAYDNRYKSTEFAMESARIMASLGIKSYVYKTLRTTPQLSFTVRHLNCDGGIMITASHNPKEYNGYKVYDKNGCQLIPELIEGVIEEIGKLGGDFIEAPKLTDQQEKLINFVGKEVDEAYLNEVLKIQLNPDLSKDDFKVVYTPQHGTSLKPVKALFEKVGYDTVYVEEQCTFDPAFSNTLVPNPEDPDAYILGIEYARKTNADIVLATDPDGDRLGVAVKDGNDYTLMTGNQTGSVLIEYILSQMQQKGIMPENPVMFNTVVTSDLGEIIAKEYGVETEKTLTGFKYIGDKIEGYRISKEKNFVFGYEESYGYLVKEFVRDKDANQSCLIIAECANFYKKKGLTLLDVLNQLYEKHGTYLETVESITLTGADGAEKLKKLLADLRANVPSEIGGYKVIKYQDFRTAKCLENGIETDIVGFDRSDVLKYFMEDGSWIAIRPSGTEPKCKFYYCIKGKNQKDVEEKKVKYFKSIEEMTK
ncbi:MAG TPA: phospho-sugar mutase [Erysipelotrichaceae bacterium]|nr:phospho-sugar mutase [Erysipelotrichaceae bacterium]HQA84452.1 phospho-sugar mutase [Erysipelotrichaceae bacterium]